MRLPRPVAPSRLAQPLVLALVLIAPALGIAAMEDFKAQLRHAGGKLAPGSTVQVQVEVRWDGRPELHAPSSPDLRLPSGASLARSRTGSEFDGSSTRWWANLSVTLPDTAPPWTIGPATVLLRSDGEVKELSALPLRLGARSALRSLLGQGIGSGFVVLFIVGWVLYRLRQLTREEDASIPATRPAQLHLSYAAGASGEEAWELLIKARLALPAMSGQNAPLPSSEALQERLERSRYGGESISDLECQELAKLLREQLEK